MQVLGLDIGGANIKAATADGTAFCLPFALWQNPRGLAEILSSQVFSRFSSPEQVGLTMSGELCDCFDDKADGVHQIIDSVLETGVEPHVYSLDGTFVSSQDAKQNPGKIAASNWHALANFTRRFLDNGADEGLLVDLGSTSCDLIPINQQMVLAHGSTDLTRMMNRELVYTGVSRSPLCAVTNTIVFRQTEIPIAQELFATMQDVYVILGDRPEQPANCDTADGRPLTRENSRRRLAKMLCADPVEMNENELVEIANSFRAVQLKLLGQAIEHQLSRLSTPNPKVIHSGSGNFLIGDLAKKFAGIKWLDLSQNLGESVCESAPAYAVAILLAESIAGE